MSVQVAQGCPISAEFILRDMLVQQFDVCEGKVATFSFTFPLPLAIHIYFGHLHCITHLKRRKKESEREQRQNLYGSSK